MPEVRKLWQTEGLFSDHYLKARLKNNDWWPNDAEAQPTFQFCKELYEKRAFALRKYDNEMGVRQEFIDKILERLGFAWSDNLRLPETKQDLEPDYILYPNGETKESVLNKSVAERYRAGVGILEAKKFGHPLSQISKHQQRYPHQQIRDYLQESDSIVWGILTNGEVWRLYCRDSKASHYFALNFEVALKSLEDFKIFLVLFSSAAFTRDAQGKCRLDQVRESALATQAELEADLRERIFTIVEILANGFAERPENKINDADLPRLYENCLIFLYRLLFILYAEGRLLLPVEPKSRKYYKQLSLARLLVPLKSFTEYDSQTQTRFYRDIHALCLVINGTDKKANDEFGVPRYNGGLFDPDHCPLLKEWAVADAVLADVLRQLMFTPEKRGQKFVPFESVDYADLSVQQLGSIYEGLLEHHFVREGGKLVLKTDKAERKATGTYYTPDYVVKYIVEQTITPLLQEIEQRKMVKAARAAGKQDNSFAGEVLKLNICDPAMGSGHFLVEATTFLADQIVYHPTTRFQAEFVKGESQEETEIAYWRRRVVEACIYGVDLNPLAVELAKLSLWLTTISSDQPLNFLDHHLRRGNSLIGARLDQLGSLPQKKSKGGAQQIHFTFGPDFKQAVAETICQIHEIERQVSLDMATVKAKEKRWETEILPRLAPYKRVADLWTNIFFDGPLSEEEYLAAAKEILVVAQESAARLQEAAARYGIKELDKPYFHWELEFPEVFFNDDGSHRDSPGFDAVIGNPPYVRIQGFPRLEIDFLAENFESATGNVDLYVSFIERGLKMLKRGGLLGEIVPNKFFKTDYGEGLRRLITREGMLTQIVDFGASQVFPATTYTCLLFLTRGIQEAFDYAEARADSHSLRSPKFTRIAGKSLDQSSWTFSTDAAADLLKKIQRDSIRLLDLPAEMSRGSSSGDDDVFMNENEDIEEGICRVPVFASDFGRYSFAPAGRWKIIFPYWLDGGSYRLYSEDELKARFPKAFAHLQNARQRLEKRKQFAQWFGYSAPRNLELHDRAQIYIPLLADRGLFAHVPISLRNEFCPMASGGFTISLAESATVNSGYVLALINSKLLFWKLAQMSNLFRGGWITCTKQYLGELPIRRIEFTTPEKSRASLVAKSKQLHQRSASDGNPDSVLAFVTEQLAARPERADIVHDLLAFLAEQMITLNREKRATAKQFLTDLKDFHGVDAHALKPKTKLDKFWELDAAEAFAHFRANKFRLKDSDEERLRTRFQTAKDKVVPLESQITFTDELIDQIVYRLYGLTAEEKALVQAAK
ncbi:MAG: N-6 DNA methylase [Verrucomicrobia bacterium]|nr:N-6 DNA methylase [Verrucomicrobiota bacterium]